MNWGCPVADFSALLHDIRRLDLAEREAYSVLLAAIERHPETSQAYRAWQVARDRHQRAQVRLDVLRAAKAARRAER